jgi:hypothetical protein
VNKIKDSKNPWKAPKRIRILRMLSSKVILVDMKNESSKVSQKFLQRREYYVSLYPIPFS